MRTVKPRKQRKKLYRAPPHERHKRFSSPLSSELKTSHSTRSVPVRKGDKVLVMRGDYKGFEGKITGVNRENYRVFVEKITREKVDGTDVTIPFHPSKVMITSLSLDDKWRIEALKRKGAGERAELPKETEPKPLTKRRKRAERKAATKSGGT